MKSGRISNNFHVGGGSDRTQKNTEIQGVVKAELSAEQESANISSDS